MSKLNELRRTASQNVKDSAGADRVDQPVGNAVVGPPERWRGVERSRDMAVIPVAKIDRDPDRPVRNSTRRSSHGWPSRCESGASSSRSACARTRAGGCM